MAALRLHTVMKAQSRKETMNRNIKIYIEDLESTDDRIRLNALQSLLKITESKIDWIYEVWDHLLEKLNNENSYQRSIAVKLLCNLAKSDSENRLEHSLDRLLVHTRDDKFITSRQCIQNIWKVAATNSVYRKKVLKHLEKQFIECTDEKHYNLIRRDIIQSIMFLHKEAKDDALLTRIQTLIAKENDGKYRKQYEAQFKVK
jgi:hypothetical protein